MLQANELRGRAVVDLDAADARAIDHAARAFDAAHHGGGPPHGIVAQDAYGPRKGE